MKIENGRVGRPLLTTENAHVNLNFLIFTNFFDQKIEDIMGQIVL